MPRFSGREINVGSGIRKKIAIVVGTFRDITVRQIGYLENAGIKACKPCILPERGIDLFSFHLDEESHLISERFMKFIAGYDYLVMSGGETAGFMLRNSNFSYIINGESIMPLVSTGSVAGGILHGVRIVLKGGLIGNDSCYGDILEWIDRQEARSGINV